MKLSYFLIADYANIEPSGKLNIIGVFQNINVKAFPALHYAMYMAVSLIAEVGDTGQTNLTIDLIDNANNLLGKLESNFVAPPEHEGRIPHVNAIFQLQGVVFEEPGKYEFVLSIDGDEKGRLPIYLIQAEEGA